MAETRIEVQIDSKEHRGLERCIRVGEQWGHNFLLWDIEDIKRKERTDTLIVYLTNNE